jgi:precorrin-6y C5,15-methyltransferase (decarboxylating) CbiE subunit
MNQPRIAIVGCGPGSPQYLSDAARQAVAGAEVIFGSPRLLAMFADHAGERVALDGHVAPLLATLAAHFAAERGVAVLVSGDPGLFSLAKNIVGQFGRDNCVVIPAVSSVQVAFARLGLDWSDARIVSAHGRTPSIAAEELSRCDKLAILGGGAESLKWIARAAEVVGASHDAYLCEDLTLDGERIRLLSSRQLAETEAASLSLVLLIRRSMLS